MKDDLISRKDVIDALGEEPPVWYDGEDEIAERNQWRRDVKAIKAVPSVQPEIVHCRDCKHRGQKPIADGRYWCEIHDTFMYYCSDAERRTDE